jgi:hypothetical protein
MVGQSLVKWVIHRCEEFVTVVALRLTLVCFNYVSGLTTRSYIAWGAEWELLFTKANKTTSYRWAIRLLTLGFVWSNQIICPRHISSGLKIYNHKIWKYEHVESSISLLFAHTQSALSHGWRLLWKLTSSLRFSCSKALQTLTYTYTHTVCFRMVAMCSSGHKAC